MPFDQHFLLAANAHHRVYVASAAEDLWASPKNEYLSCVAASGYFKALGKVGFVHPDRVLTNSGAREGDVLLLTKPLGQVVTGSCVNTVLAVAALFGGMGCGLLCGAIAGAMAALGQQAVTERAHVTEGFKDLCADTAAKMEEALGSVNCSVIKPAFFVEGRRCAETVRRAADVLEKQMEKLRA